MVAQLIAVVGSQPNESTTIYRSSILDITQPSKFSGFVKFGDPTNTTLFNDNGVLDASLGDWEYGTTIPGDPVAGYKVQSHVEGAVFDISFKLSSPVLLDGGIGQFGPADSPVFEWTVPSCKTDGWIEISGKKVDIIPEKSLTWYDRQWGAVPSSFQWFGIHLPGSAVDGSEDVILSTWILEDEPVGPDGMLTLQRWSTG